MIALTIMCLLLKVLKAGPVGHNVFFLSLFFSHFHMILFNWFVVE